MWKKIIKALITSNTPSSGKSEQCMAFCTFVFPYFALREFGLICRAMSYIE